MSKDEVQAVLAKYTYNPKAGKELSPRLEVFKGVHQENNTPVCIKILKGADQEQLRYLQKLRDTKSQYVARVFDVASNPERAVAVFEDAPYGTLANAMTKCRRLEDSDAVFVAKSIINGHIDILRSGGKWAGSFADIEITEGGLKLSWNGSEPNAEENPVPKLLEKLTARDPSEEKGLLPFPDNKQILDLVKVSNENASEMSLHPLLKKRDKVYKKKGKGWLALKETKSKGEYFEEVVYLAASPIHGFVRVKAYEQGQLEKQALALNKTKNTFVKVLDDYDEGSTTYIVSEYANDGNLQQYVNKLKAANVRLKEDQIEFFLYSLIDPLKQVQQSSLQSINSMHIRNIFIENGIPKIGEPVPMTAKIEDLLRDRFDVPDFYHSKFKSSPNTHDPSFDTYSLGILLYKLMYTEYPIFPEGQVHIPTTPSYNQRIKTTLEVFLNIGGRLSELESKIEVSESVKKQIKENKVKLQAQKVKPNRQSKVAALEINESNNNIEENDELLKQENKPEESCWKALCQNSDQDQAGKISQSFYIECENSPFSKYRMCTKIILIILFYILVLYLWFLNRIFDMFVKTSVFQPLNVSISSQNYTVITSDTYSFYTSFNATGTKDISALNNTLKCAVDANTTIYSGYVKSSSVGWILFLSLALVSFVFLILVKVFQLGYYDSIRAVFNYQTRRLNYNISSYIIFNLVFALTLFSHYFMFNYIYDSQTTPCFGGDATLWFTSSITLFTDRSYVHNCFIQLFQYVMPPALACFVLLILNFAQILVHQRTKYSKLFNPIVLFGPFLLALTILMRVGVYTPYKPSWINYSVWITQIRSANYITVLGMFPEAMVLGEHVISFAIDWIFWRCLDRKVRTMVHDQSASEEFRDVNNQI